MTETNRFIGRKFEKKVTRHLKNLGCFVTRTHRGRGEIDIVAVTPSNGIKIGNRRIIGTMLIQCKANGYMPPEEWTRLQKFATNYWTPLTRVVVASENRASWRKELDFKEVPLPPITTQDPPCLDELPPDNPIKEESIRV